MSQTLQEVDLREGTTKCTVSDAQTKHKKSNNKFLRSILDTMGNNSPVILNIVAD